MMKTLKENNVSEINQNYETDPSFYTSAIEYWNNVPATANGMLGGHIKVSNADICSSENFLKAIFKLENPPGHYRAVDCGAGIGRITMKLLQRYFGKVDLVEQCSNFIEKAKENLSHSKKVGEFYCTGLQNFNVNADTYDVVWIQWVTGHLTDRDFFFFFQRMSRSLKNNGVIVLKENVSSSCEVEYDKTDSSVTRPLSLILELFSKADLTVIRSSKQRNFPKSLFEVRLFCLRPSEKST